MKHTQLMLIFQFVLLMSCGETKESTESVEQLPPLAGSSDTSARNTSYDYNYVNELDDPERDEWQKPGLVIDEFGNLENKTIADIGAGSGYFTFRMAARGATVLAIDIDSNFLDHIEEQALEASPSLTGRITTRISPPGSPSLQPGEVEGALIVNTASFLPQRKAYFEEIFRGLSSKGKVVIVDFKTERSPVSPPENLLVSSEKLASELKIAGFVNVRVNSSSLPYQYIITAVKP